jgi:dTDP-4-amino-4,6-dideoxygalactose transaminase
VKFLSSKGIQTGVHYPISLPKLRAYSYLKQDAEKMFANRADKTLLSLPIGEHLEKSEMQEIVSAIKGYFS